MFTNKHPVIVDPVITPLANGVMQVEGFTELGFGINFTAIRVDLVKQQITTTYSEIFDIRYFGKTKKAFPDLFCQEVKHEWVEK